MYFSKRQLKRFKDAYRSAGGWSGCMMYQHITDAELLHRELGLSAPACGRLLGRIDQRSRDVLEALLPAYDTAGSKLVVEGEGSDLTLVERKAGFRAP